MASTQALSNAAQDRKARLAQLKSLKRKAPNTQEDIGEDVSQSVSEEPSNAAKPAYLSGRNYDIESKGVKLGFEHAPSEGQNTLERQAAALSEEAQRQAAKEQQEDKPLDLFKLQPKKPNWDLKRDLDRKLDVLNVRMDNAIARLVRDRIAVQQKLAKAEAGISGIAGSVNRGASQGDGEAAGIEGTALVEAMNVKEREVEEDMRREREEDAALLDES